MEKAADRGKERERKRLKKTMQRRRKKKKMTRGKWEKEDSWK